MSIPKFKRKPNGLEYVDNAYVIQVETLRLVSKLNKKKLNKKWTNIYIIPIEKYVCKQAEPVSMANGVNPVRYEDILLRRILLLFSKSCMDVLDKKLKKINDKEIDDGQIIDLLVSKFVKKIIFDNF